MELNFIKKKILCFYPGFCLYLAMLFKADEKMKLGI